MKYFFLILFSFPLLVFGQGNADSIRFEMIKKTVEFLARDKKISKQAGLKIMCSPNRSIREQYLCLESGIAAAKFTAVLPKVRFWDGKKTGNTLDDLEQLKQKIIDDITTPAAKAYRKKINGYNEYLQSLAHLIKIYKPAAGQTKKKAESPEKPVIKDTIPKPKPQAKPPAQIKADPPKTDTQQTGTQETDTSKQVISADTKPYSLKNTDMTESNNTLIAIAISILAIAISLFSILKKSKNPPQLAEATKDHTPEIKGLKADIKTLEERLRQSNERAAKDMETLRQSMDNRISELERRPYTIELPVSNSMPAAQHAPRPAAHIAEVAPEPLGMYKYAKFSDIEGGFSAGILTDNQNGEQTFEITIDGDKALYGVSEDARAQSYALHSYEYLADVCEIKGQPKTGGRIDTLTKGKLTRSTDGNWLIETKAVIELR